MDNSTRVPVLGISQGDYNGIGYEVIIKSLNDSRIFDLCTPILYGQSKVFSYYKKNFGLESLSYNLIRYASQAIPKRLNVINLSDEEIKIEPGTSTTQAGKASLVSLQMAMNDIKSGTIDALVTAPINKQNIQSAEFRFHGHTEFLASYFDNAEPLMLMVQQNLRVGTLTNHIGIKEVSSAVTKELILNKLNVFNKSLKQDFNISSPRIAVMALNPHAGDGGVIGTEEKNIIIPAIEEALQKGIYAFGPFPADGFFGSGAWTKYDGILTMYHDQAMIAFKILANEGGVNFTAGLPMVRTSPAHGTAYDIANKDIADPESFRHALFLAIDIVGNRRKQ